MRVGYLQFRPRFGEISVNTARILRALKGARADLIVLPELPFTGYCFASRRELSTLAEDPRKSQALESLIALCRERDFFLITGFAERARDRIFNSSLLLGPRGLLQTYRKVHLFKDEKRWFDPGDLPFALKSVRGLRVGMLICFDYIFPEATRALALKGMDLLAHPSNLVLDYCQRAMFARSVENGIFSITANRFGEDRRPHGSLLFTGKSQVVGPRGKILRRAPGQRQELAIVTIDPARARDKFMTPRNHLLRDRRPEFYL
jgi:predicted amidohydrolase